jgi:hypothetical protein
MGTACGCEGMGYWVGGKGAQSAKAAVREFGAMAARLEKEASRVFGGKAILSCIHPRRSDRAANPQRRALPDSSRDGVPVGRRRTAAGPPPGRFRSLSGNVPHGQERNGAGLQHRDRWSYSINSCRKREGKLKTPDLVFRRCGKKQAEFYGIFMGDEILFGRRRGI